MIRSKAIDRIRSRLTQINGWNRLAWEWWTITSTRGENHPASLGTLLALVSEAHGCECKLDWGRRSDKWDDVSYGQPIEWNVWCMDRPRTATGATKLEALSLALEAEPQDPSW